MILCKSQKRPPAGTVDYTPYLIVQAEARPSPSRNPNPEPVNPRYTPVRRRVLVKNGVA
jgi:hypothetical protein